MDFLERVVLARYPDLPVFMLGESMGGGIAVMASMRPNLPKQVKVCLSLCLCLCLCVFLGDCVSLCARSMANICEDRACGRAGGRRGGGGGVGEVCRAYCGEFRHGACADSLHKYSARVNGAPQHGCASADARMISEPRTWLNTYTRTHCARLSDTGHGAVCAYGEDPR